MRESAIERKVCAYAKQRGCEVYKFVSPGRRGVPDRMFVTPKGKVFFIEFKAPTGKMTALQKREIEKLRSKDVDVFVCWSQSHGEMLMDTIL